MRTPQNRCKSAPPRRLFCACFTAFLVLAAPMEVHADPAFLASGAVPNLLIVMDNSKSMLDLAYAPDAGACYDSMGGDSPGSGATPGAGYDRTTTYAGYFSTDSWYAYDPDHTMFKTISRPSACPGEGGAAYTHTKGAVEDLCLQRHPDALQFTARGNLLNWATASRFDIQKKVLTGGKFDHRDRTLVSEGRGCPGTRFIRQLRIWDTGTGTAHVLSLGIRPMDPGLDQTTAVEVFFPRLTGFDDSACQSIFDTMPPPVDDLESLQVLLAACVENSELPFELPRAADPSMLLPPENDRVNLPALLTDVQADRQLGAPPLVMRAVIYDSRYADTPPRGILHASAGRLRVGIMQFNHDGSPHECALFDQGAAGDVLLDLAENDCSGNSLDGGRVLVDIADTTPDHVDTMVGRINAARADAWSPLSEAVFTAIGYYTRRPDMRINPSDFPLDAGPCTHWCQSNNILVITDGASTVDLHPKMTTFASVEGQNDGSRDSMDGCPGLFGSTFLDDITAYGFSGSNIHLEAPFDADEHFQNIKTYFVVAGPPGTRGEGECSPATLLAKAAANGGSKAPFYARDPRDLQDELKFALNMVRSGGYAGPTASVFSAGGDGGGAVYRSRFWSTLPDTGDMDAGARADRHVSWMGDVNALLMDADGRLYEDTDDNNALNAFDARVIIYHDKDANEPRACSQDLSTDGSCEGTAKALEQVKHLWSAAEWLSGIADADVSANRDPYISDAKMRYIFTWDDLDNNGAVAENEVLPFVPLNDWRGPGLAVAADRAPVPVDFGVDTTQAVNDIVNWIRGLDAPLDPASRSRQAALPPNFSADHNPDVITWRLGDVIHSTPTVVAGPGEKYHLLYDDDTYAAYAAAHHHRRQVIYFGGNDGMVHAVNGGFHDAAGHKFWRSYDAATGRFSDTGPELGAELWAYVPYNLLPHLKRLTRAGYRHAYYVDLTPRVFDVQIFDASPDSHGHVHGWGTIMVVGMRLGGDRISAREIMAEMSPTASADSRVFTSAYMVFDISDPENPPRLLGELTYQPGSSADLAYTTALPAVVPIKTGENSSDWFLILGSGPTDADGVSTQDARICIFPLSELEAGQAFRIPATATYSHASAGSFKLSDSPRGFVSAMAVADYHLDDRYRADVVYFGTIEGGWGDWGGRLYRWVTNQGYPQNWNNPAVMINPRRPVTAAPAVGFDGNFHWVYFGTGRFMSVLDKTDARSNAQDYFFGVKEPVDMHTGSFTWAPIEYKLATSKPPAANDAGSRTLLRVDRIEVEEGLSATAAHLSCRNETGCLPDHVDTFRELSDYIAGTCDAFAGCTGADGWVRAFETNRERNLGQATLLGGLISFTTYQPFDDICQPAGQSFFYNLHYQTGTPFWAATVDPRTGRVIDADDVKSPRMSTACLPVGRGLAVTPRLVVGRPRGSQAFIQTTSGALTAIHLPDLPVKSVKSGRLSWRSD